MESLPWGKVGSELTACNLQQQTMHGISAESDEQCPVSIGLSTYFGIVIKKPQTVSLIRLE